MAELEDEDDLLSSLLDVAEAELNSLNGIQKSISENVTPLITKEKFLSDVDKFTNNISSKRLPLQKQTKIKRVEKTLTSCYEEGLDSSDEEASRNYEKQKYNEYGRKIKNLLIFNNSSNTAKLPAPTQNSQSSEWKAKSIIEKTSADAKTNSLKLKKPTTNVYTDPIFGINIINPLISSKVLQERMVGRKAIPICQINRHLKSLKKDDDWVIAGIICSKGVTKTSANGNQYIIWTMSDLLGNIKTIALFLFGSAYKQFWKTQPGYVVGILNPSILDKREGSKDEAILSIDNAQKILILGQSKDLGTCKSTKKNGEKCTAVVNKNKCEVCIYHIRQEYQKCSQRSELQANYSGKGLIALRNKVLGKNEVFYAGKSYTAIPAKQSKKLLKKDQNRLQSLSGVVTTSAIGNQKTKNTFQKAAASFDVVRSQRIKDIETLRKLGVNTNKYGSLGTLEDFKANHSNQVTLNESKTNALKVLSKLNDKNNGINQTLEVMTNSNEKYNDPEDLHNSQLQKSLDEIVSDDFINLNVNHETTKEQHDRSAEKVIDDRNETSVSEMSSHEKIKVKDTKKSKYTDLVFSKSLIMSAVPTLTKNDNYIDLNEPTIPRQAHRAKLKALQIIHKNPLTKSDPNKIKGRGLKRNVDAIEVSTNSLHGKKLKSIKENEFLSDRFKKMMELQSKHLDLIEIRDNEEKQKYFRKLEVKEQLEEKMANTYKIECKAVRCLTCKYTSFSAADKCKKEKHRLKVFNAIKRFFKCGHCGNRIACLDVVPIHTCKNCGSGNWERTTMIKEKRVLNTVSLSIRGGEQKYISSTVTDANINLLVPDED